ncbi:hypothetical protein [Halomontanus rarus]|uniref:hypothetical protein n=1 Tax=Halomontanus rarus TaxID=3034020 RepID=UPI001A98D43C
MTSRRRVLSSVGGSIAGVAGVTTIGSNSGEANCITCERASLERSAESGGRFYVCSSEIIADDYPSNTEFSGAVDLDHSGAIDSVDLEVEITWESTLAFLDYPDHFFEEDDLLRAEETYKPPLPISSAFSFSGIKVEATDVCPPLPEMNVSSKYHLSNGGVVHIENNYGLCDGEDW